jgi:hypothetical protein
MITLKTDKSTIESGCSCRTSVEIYETGRQTSASLFAMYQSFTGEGDKDDLLRAMLLFACSTFDSVGKRLTEDCLEELIDKEEGGAQEQFEDFVKRNISKDPASVLSKVLTRQNYRQGLINLLIKEIKGSSLQSYEQLGRLTSYFGIKTDDVISIQDAKSIFEARNKITHEMDIIVASEPTGNSAQKKSRAEGELKDFTEKILYACKNLVEEVHKKIHEPRAEDSIGVLEEIKVQLDNNQV